MHVAATHVVPGIITEDRLEGSRLCPRGLRSTSMHVTEVADALMCTASLQHNQEAVSAHHYLEIGVPLGADMQPGQNPSSTLKCNPPLT